MNYEIDEKNVKTFFNWIYERDQIFKKKLSGETENLTEDQILEINKFTNVQRWLDRESQYLIANVIGDDDRSFIDTTFRIILFKTFNLGKTWAYLEKEVGDITWREGILEEIIEAMEKYPTSGFSSAYLMASNFVLSKKFNYLKGKGKAKQYLTMLEYYFFNEDGFEVFEDLRCEPNMLIMTEWLQFANGIGKFMSYQLVQDLNYSKWYCQDMSEYVLEGPGSIRGVQRLFPTVPQKEVANVIKYVYDNFEELWGIWMEDKPIPDNFGVGLQLPDLQNCFCEVDKYIRIEEKLADPSKRGTMKKYNPKNYLEIVKPKKWVTP